MNRKHKRILLLTALLVVLIGSDLVIGLFGDYSGKTDGDYSIEALAGYIETLTWERIAIILVFSVFILLLIHFVFKKW